MGSATKAEKLSLSMRYWLLGMAQNKPEYALALKAFDFAASYHTGKRRGGDPEFIHQLSIGHYLRTLAPSLQYPVETLAAAALHDLVEDYFVPLEQVRLLFGCLVADAVEKLSKQTERNGPKKELKLYFEAISVCPIASVVKGADRIHNLSTMQGAFSQAKQLEYISETETYFIPMIKTARRSFGVQEPVYENIKLMLSNQLELLKAIHSA